MSQKALQRPTFRRFFEQAVENDPTAPFLVWGESEWTYEAFDREVNKAARAWLQLGVRHGDRVAFALRNHPEFLAAWFGLSKAGGVLVGLNPELEPEGLSHALELTEPVVVLHEDDLTDRINGLSAAVARTVRLGSSGDDESFEGNRRTQSAVAPEVDASPDDLISLIFTSGTTGKPKAVMQTHHNYVRTGEAFPSWVGMGARDTLYLCLPLFHVNGQAYSTLGVVGAGASLALAERFSASRFWPDVRRTKSTYINMVGAMLIILDRRAPDVEDANNDVTLIYSAGAVTGLSAEERHRIETRYGAALLGGYGMSEATFGCIEPYDGERKPGTMGLPRQHPDPSIPPTEIRLVKDDGTEADVGEPGEISIRSPALMAGYFRDEAATASVIRDGWFYTGDIAKRDEDGYFYFVDRKKDVIRRRGENLYAGEVADVLRSHEDIEDAAVVGIPSEFMDDDVFAFVIPVSATAYDPEAILNWTARRLAAYKVPRFLLSIQDFPRTTTNKLSRSELRELAISSRDRAYDHEEHRRRTKAD